MKTFFKWLKDGNADRTVEQEVKSYERRHDGWMKTSGEQILQSKFISNQECQLLLNMQRYLEKYPEVDKAIFLQMLNYEHQDLQAYRPLVEEVEKMNINIVDFLFELNWLILANNIANERFTEAEKHKPKAKKETIKEFL